MEECNALARAAGQYLPYPDLKALGLDNGERFLYEYFLEQVVALRHTTLY